jgi:formylglycine-generating enzyme required for sulfatase activity
MFQDCPTCPVMLRLAGGSFMMGLGSKLPETAPVHRVTLRGFAIGRFPVTIGEWQACVADKGCKSTPPMNTTDVRAPIHNVSWDDADQFAHWLARLTDRKYRLPTEAEWEYAARGGTTSRYWWGETMGVTAANCADCEGTQNPRAPLPVDGFEANPFGLVDVLGGVAQWTADCWFATYQGAPPDGSARVAKDCEKRVLRGGSFRNKHDDITVTGRNNYDQPVRYNPNGFRIARDLE